MANYDDDYIDDPRQLATTTTDTNGPSSVDASSSLSTAQAAADGQLHGPVASAPPWFNDLIQHGFDGLLNIVTKNLNVPPTLRDRLSTGSLVVGK